MRGQSSEDVSDFYKTMANGDDLAVVVKGAIYIEQQLARLIEVNLMYPSELGQMEYSSRVKLAIAIGVDPSYKSSLNAIGNLRNKFAHTLKTAIDNSDAESIYQSLSSDAKNICHTMYEKLAKKDRSGKWPSSMRGLSPKDKFIIYVITIRAALLSAVMHCERVRLGVDAQRATPEEA